MGGHRKVKKYIKALQTCETKTEAKIKAGYYPTYTPENTETFKRLIAEQLPDDTLVKPIKEALGATKTTAFQGEVYGSYFPDHQIRIDAAEKALKLKGRVNPDVLIDLRKIEIIK